MPAAPVKESPLLMTGEMVRATFADLKTQTRRVVKPQPGLWPGGLMYGVDGPGTARFVDADYPDGPSDMIRCPYGAPGDLLWVRETWGVWHRGDATLVRGQPYDPQIAYRADDEDPDIPHDLLWEPFRWRPSIHMPKKLCRLWLEVKDVRVERVQDITPRDAQAEGDKERSGMPEYYARGPLCYVDWFRYLWDSINAKPREVRVRGEIVSYVAYPWDASHSICRETQWRGKPLLVYPNPWVWVIEYERMGTPA